MFKSIEYKLIIFVLLLILSVALTTYLITQQEYVYIGVSVLLMLYSLKSLYSHYKKFNQNILFLLFIPFFTTKDYGTGIGLSVSRYIMRLHGGNLKHHTSGE